MARSKIVEGEDTVKIEFLVGTSQRERLEAHAARLGKKVGEICRRQILKYLAAQDAQVRKLKHSKAVAKRAAKKSRRTFQIGKRAA